MFRYVGLIWNDADPVARAAAQRIGTKLKLGPTRWQESLDLPGLVVFHCGERAVSNTLYRLRAGRGVVLGKLFGRCGDGTSSAARAALDEEQSVRIVATSGRHLVDHYWGRYVAFLRDPATTTTWVLRDPTAVMHCQWVEHEGVRVYFSCIGDVLDLVPMRFSVNWKYIGAALACQRLQLNETALTGVSQVLGGECVESARGTVSASFYWNPLVIACTDVIEDVGRAAREMRQCVRDCVHAWASCHESLVHTLSGGLDSSIVMACLRDAPSHPTITCVNYHSKGSDGDEREYARLSAHAAGQALLERERNAELSFEPLLDMRRTSVPPSTFLYHLENSRGEAELAAERGATAIFSGNTGDQLFYQAFAAFGAGDFIQRHGLRRAAFGVALDAARLDSLSVWRVLKDGVAHGLLGRRWKALDFAGTWASLLSADVVSETRRNDAWLHPLFREPGRCPSGKLFHAQTLLFPPELYNPMGGSEDPELISPLYSQPLIELALRIPTYVLTSGGWERAIARRAFQRDVPREIVTRTTKGGVEEHARAIFTRNIGLVRELMLDGLLAREGILDGGRVGQVLSGSPTRAGGASAEIYECLSAEAWARRWCDANTARAAA